MSVCTCISNARFVCRFEKKTTLLLPKIIPKIHSSNKRISISKIDNFNNVSKYFAVPSEYFIKLPNVA